MSDNAVTRILDEATSIPTTLTNIPHYEACDELLVQIEITGTASISVEGCADDQLTPVEVVAAVSANALQPIAWVPWLRCAGSISSGTVTVSVVAAKRQKG